MKELGLNVFLVINEDGTVSMNLFGSDLAGGKWTASSDTKARVVFEEDEENGGDLTLADDELTLESAGQTMVFARSTQERFEEFMDDEEEDEEASKDAGAAAASSETATVTGGIDNDIINFTITDMYVDDSNDLMVRYNITNKTDKSIVFTDEDGDFTVNGQDADITCITRMEPGETVEDDFLFFVGGGSLVDDINNVTFSGVFEVHDSDYNVLGTYDFTL